MINYYQPFLLPFLGPRSYRMPENVHRTYFLSFEDSLWVLLKQRHIPKRAIILIPDFYCMDVVDNIRAHGYSPVFYPLDSQLRITPQKLNSLIKKHAPGVTIIFHACGITRISDLTIAGLCTGYPDMLVIEDAVHKLIHPETVTLTHPNHYLIDSLRKVSPLPGSFLYQTSGSKPITPDVTYKEWWYSLSVHVYFRLFRAIFVLGNIFHNTYLIRYAHEKTLRAHDDIVGDSDGGYTGMTLVPHIHAYFNFEKIQKQKYAQTRFYEMYLEKVITDSPLWYRIRITEEQKENLHVFPIGIKSPNTRVMFKRIETYLHQRGIVVWFKFPDSAWSNERGILFLPLGFHITNRDIDHIMATLRIMPMPVPET